MEACGKRLQKRVSESVVTKHDMTNQILFTLTDRYSSQK